MSGKDHFESTLIALLQDAYFPEDDVDKKLKHASSPLNIFPEVGLLDAWWFHF